MASTDWTYLNDGLDINSVDRGVTTGIARPSGGGNFVFGFNSLNANSGAVGLFTNQTNFAPMAKGASIRGAVKRLPSGGPTGFSPFFFAGLSGNSVNDPGYLLGLGDADPYHLILKKGVLLTGTPDLAPDPEANGILLRSVATFDQDTWHHLRLDMIANENGDVLLQVFANDLAANPLGDAPDWVPVPGMEEFIDDALGVNSGSQPYTSGRAGFGIRVQDVTRRAAFDHVEVYRQL